MAYCPQEQIDRAYAAWQTNNTNAMIVNETPLLARCMKRGFNSGYTLGEDAGFDRGWYAAEWHYRPWWIKLWHLITGVKYKEQRRFMNDE